MEKKAPNIIGLEKELALVVTNLAKTKESRLASDSALYAAKFVLTHEPDSTVHFGSFEQGAMWSHIDYLHKDISRVNRDAPILGGSAVTLRIWDNWRDPSKSKGIVEVIGRSSEFGPIERVLAEQVGERVRALLSESLGLPFTMNLGNEALSDWK
jgi:hypothetical protein